MAEHRADSVHQQCATDHAGRRRGGRAKERSARTESWAGGHLWRITKPSLIGRRSHRRSLSAGRAYARHRTARLTSAEHGLAHAVEEATLLLDLRTAVELRFQLFHPGVGALERLVLNEGGLHQRVDGVWRAAKPVRDHAFGLRIARSILNTRQSVEQFVD